MLAIAKVDEQQGVRIIDYPEPAIIETSDVLVEVGACGICGTDLNIYMSDEVPISQMKLYGWPRILGHEVAGTVRGVGEAVTGFQVGDRVVCDSSPACGSCFYCRRGYPSLCERKGGKILGFTRHGGFAKYVLASSFSLHKLPESIPFEEGAVLVEAAGVAIHAVEKSSVKPGDKVVVIGPGPIGIIASMLIKLCGVQTLVVAGTEADKDRLEISTGIGAHAVEVTGTSLETEVNALTAGRGADVVFICAGGAQPLNQAVKVARAGGQVIDAAGGERGEFERNWIMMKELTLIGCRTQGPSTWDRALDLVMSKNIDLRKVISHVLHLEEYEVAFKALLDKKAMKIVIVP